MLHGKGYDRWFDKSFTMVISANGRVGLNTEHSWADAPVTGHMWEYILADEIFAIGYDSQGQTKGNVRFDLPNPIKLRWEFNSEMEEVIMESYKVAYELLNDVDLHIYAHDAFGKGFSKECKTSPDAFVQMALQLAYYRDIGKHHLTYEASMTRLFREGRTETVRSCSIESSNWVKAMCDSNSTVNTLFINI
jgi:carnitine O-palmitoyltransferase 1